jgi:hypothetical protein
MDQNQIEAMKNVRSMKYGLTITLGGTPGDRATGSVVINRSDFALCELQHCVVGDDGTDPMQYTIDFSLQNTERFHKGPNAPLALLFGSPRTNIWSKYKPPIQIEENTTVYIELINNYAAPGDERTIQIWLDGAEKRRKVS